MCGEKENKGSRRHDKLGSPPRVRGKGFLPACPRFRSRITPACAGKSSILDYMGIPTKDHPRVCGEKGYFRSSDCLRVGSPPRVRGKDAAVRHTLPDDGITPACAGKRNCGCVPVMGRWDHPRVCGEKLIQIFLSLFFPGSPPRVRGKVTQSNEWFQNAGITPACAGKSS